MTKRCLEMGGYATAEQNLARSMNDGYTSVSVFNGGENILVTGESAFKYWREMGTDVTVSFPANVLLSIFSLATTKNATGKFIVDVLSTDGGGIRCQTVEISASLGRGQHSLYDLYKKIESGTVQI